MIGRKMGVEARMEEIAKEKGLKTKTQIEKERLEKLNDKKTGLNYLFNAQHKEITVVFMDDKEIIGILKSFSVYEICLKVENAGNLIILKHSIKYWYENTNKTKEK